MICVTNQKLTSNLWSSTDLFGMSVAIDPATGTIIVGQPWGNWYNSYPVISVNDAGAAYVFVQ